MKKKKRVDKKVDEKKVMFFMYYSPKGLKLFDKALKDLIKKNEIR